MTRAPSTEVSIAVRERCVRAEDIPTPPKTAMKAGDIRRKAAGALADAIAYDEYIQKADTIMRACAARGDANGEANGTE